MKKFIITSIILTLSFSVNAQSWWNTKKVRGNGNITTETRKTSDYDGVSFGGNFDVELVRGKEGKITLKGEENLLKYIEVDVKRGILKIQVQKGINIRTTRKLLVTVPYIDIEKVSLSGSGDLTNKGTIKADKLTFSVAGSGDMNVTVDANQVKTNIAGSGNITVVGKTTDLKCSIAGSGDINAYGLTASSTSANIAGSGNIKTTVSDKVDARVVGSGNIYYKGKPTHINSKSVGSGSVVSRN